MSTLFSTDIAHCLDRSFAWDANTEPDLAGYRIYYKTGDAGPIYDGTGAVEGDSPIQIPLTNLNDPQNPEYTIHRLSDTGTFYFVATAYDIYGNESGYSTVLCFGSTCAADIQGTGESGGGCFIATAAFGSKFEKQVRILGRFRNLYLMPHTIGRAFVRVYYRYSPPMADVIADYRTLRIAVRISLLPIIGLSWILLHLGAGPTLLILSLMGAVVWLCAKKKNFRRSTTDI
ncbi:MAG: hypothetical protein JRE28_11800 [Deltaproteobacteria bacterium]|nr:hypothetical protein [Deltaproteobacteria bacterium]